MNEPITSKHVCDSTPGYKYNKNVGLHSETVSSIEFDFMHVRITDKRQYALYEWFYLFFNHISGSRRIFFLRQTSNVHYTGTFASEVMSPLNSASSVSIVPADAVYP